MRININTMSLTNFKCFRFKELHFDSDITTIRGRNGAGKTTIADAVLFCLFGKNTEGQSDLELFKTRENGKTIPNLDHSVEIELAVSDGGLARQVILKRSIKEVWVKKRGSEESVFKNNTVEYFVNGESYTKTDYEKYIVSMIDEKVFRAITNPTYFPSLKWQDQRAFLTTMVGDVKPEPDTDELKELVAYLEGSNEDLEAYLKHLKYQIKQIKDKLDKIPVRLEEENKALPEKLDWEAIQSTYDATLLQLKDVEAKILSLQQGNGADIKREEIRKQIRETQAAIEEVERTAKSIAMADEGKKAKAVQEASLRFNEALSTQKLMEQAIAADKRLIERTKETIEECLKIREELLAKWPKEKFTYDPNTSHFCPTCGQLLPDELIQQKVEEMRNAFNLDIEVKKKAINEKGQKNNETKVQAEEELKNLEQQLADHQSTLAEIKEDINNIFAEKASIEKQGVKTVAQLLSENVQYAELSKQLQDFIVQLANVTDSEDNTQALADLQQQKSDYETTTLQLNHQLASRAQYDRILALIDSIHEEEKELVKQLSELERKEDTARQYQFRTNQLLEERINQHFKLVQWKLFRTVNNGGDSFEEPFCECYVDGQSYHGGLNQAARLNAGLDICNTLCRFYNVSAPLIIDNAESALEILPTIGQQLRLQVFDSELQTM